MSRAERLNERFKLIQQTLSELHGKELAFAAASAAWLMAIQHGFTSGLKRCKEVVEKEEGPCYPLMDLIPTLDAENEVMLRGYHKELCVHLNVDPARALELAKAFEQVVRDICFQGG